MTVVIIDIETLPNQDNGAIEEIASTLTVKAPDLTKPKLIEIVEGGDKFKSVAELKEMWIEQNGEQAKTEQATEKWLKTSFDGGSGQICCICVDIEGVKYEFITTSDSDKYLIVLFWNTIKEHTLSPYFVAHNAKFDLPFLFHRSIINNIAPASGFNPYGRHGQSHFCTMEAWAGFNGKIGLDKLAKILGLGSKTEGMDGSQVWPEFQKGNIKEIVNYCHDDVSLTKVIYERLTIK